MIEPLARGGILPIVKLSVGLDGTALVSQGNDNLLRLVTSIFNLYGKTVILLSDI